MRTLITLLLLACFAWTRATAADCPMAPAPSGEPEHVAASASTHHGHPAPAPAPAGEHGGQRHPASPVHHLAGGCGVLAACGAGAVPSIASALPSFHAQRADGMAARRDAYASPTLSTDPPPPRSALRS